MDCTSLKSCSLVASKRNIASLQCPAGTGIRDGLDFQNCSAPCLHSCVATCNEDVIAALLIVLLVTHQVCDDNFTQKASDTRSKCVPCPPQNEYCYANKFKMMPGHMVEEKNISFTIYCPNPAACPGGNSTNMSTMCAQGYRNRSCATCDDGHAISDSSVLLCTRCASGRKKQVLQWAYMLVKHIVPFTLAANSALQLQDAEVPWPLFCLASNHFKQLTREALSLRSLSAVAC